MTLERRSRAETRKTHLLAIGGLVHDPVELAVELGVAADAQTVCHDATGHDVERLTQGGEVVERVLARNEDVCVAAKLDGAVTFPRPRSWAFTWVAV